MGDTTLDNRDIQKHILSEIKELRKENKELFDHIVQMKIDLSALKIKASIWGGMAGMLPLLLTKGKDLLGQ